MNINELHLETHVRAQPNAIIEWTKDSVPITRDNPKYQQFDHSDGLCELIVNDPTEKDSGKYICKATNRCGTTEIPHFVLFDGIQAHIAENIHRIFHADHNRLDRAKTEVRELLGGLSNGVENGDATEEEKGKKGGKGKAKGGKGSDQAPPPATTSLASSAPVKKEPREQRVALHFPTKLSNRVAAAGTKVKLTCYLEGADPAIRWLKDEQPVVYSPKCRQNNLNGLCSLEFTSVTEADSGIYKCYARNTLGESSTSAKLEVYASGDSADLGPTFTRGMKETYNSKINEINITCHVRGIPKPTITWSKDGVTLEPSDKYQLIEHDDGLCELNISDCTRQDNGKYVCQAENRAGQTETVHEVQVEIRQQRSSIISLKDVPTEEAVEEPKVEEKAEEPAAKGKGQPRKKAGGAAGGGGRRHQPVPPPDPKQQLYFRAFLTDRAIPEGGKTKLSCYIDGPDPQLRWSKNDQPLQMSPRCRAEVKDGLVTLSLLSAVLDDTGEYRVLARNQASEITSSCSLTVYNAIKQTDTVPIFTGSIKGKTIDFLFCVCIMLTYRLCLIFITLVSKIKLFILLRRYRSNV